MTDHVETERSELGLPIFEGPMCLVETTSDGKLIACEKTLNQIATLDKELVVVSIVGLYRTGKSFIMNRLAGLSSGFALGATIESTTKGIWAWAKPHPLDDNKYLLLIDTEGLGDVEKGNATHDAWIFCLATLLSSALVYNVMGAITDDSLKQIHFISTMSKHIRTKQNTSPDDSDNFDWYFPNLIMAIRDFNLELNFQGKEITEDEYFENCLNLKPEKDRDAQRFNETRFCIRKFFKSRRCFTFDRPGGRKVLRKLETVDESAISPDFIEDANKFCDHVYNHGPIKKLETGQSLNGGMWTVMVRTYIEAIRRGDVPCIENATDAMATIENTKAVKAGVESYREHLCRTVKLPTPDDDTLSNQHAVALLESIKLFLSKAICDKDLKYQQELNDQILVEYENMVRANGDASKAKCWDRLNTLDQVMKTKLERGDYSIPGGYAVYSTDLQEVQKEYSATTGLGVKAKEILIEYVDARLKEGTGIIASDKQLSELEKQVNMENKRAVEAENKRKLAEKETENVQKLREEREKAIHENQKQLNMQHEREMNLMREHQEQIMHARQLDNERLAAEQEQLRCDYRNLQNKQCPARPKPASKCTIS